MNDTDITSGEETAEDTPTPAIDDAPDKQLQAPPAADDDDITDDPTDDAHNDSTNTTTDEVVAEADAFTELREQIHLVLDSVFATTLDRNTREFLEAAAEADFVVATTAYIDQVQAMVRDTLQSFEDMASLLDEFRATREEMLSDPLILLIDESMQEMIARPLPSGNFRRNFHRWLQGARKSQSRIKAAMQEMGVEYARKAIIDKQRGRLAAARKRDFFPEFLEARGFEDILLTDGATPDEIRAALEVANAFFEYEARRGRGKKF